MVINCVTSRWHVRNFFARKNLGGSKIALVVVSYPTYIFSHLLFEVGRALRPGSVYRSAPVGPEKVSLVCVN